MIKQTLKLTLIIEAYVFSPSYFLLVGYGNKLKHSLYFEYSKKM